MGEKALTLPAKISYLEFLIFFLKSFDKLYLEQYDFGLPQSAISLRLTLDIFRVISEDNMNISINSLINYANKSQLFPLTIT